MLFFNSISDSLIEIAQMNELPQKLEYVCRILKNNLNLKEVGIVTIFPVKIHKSNIILSTTTSQLKKIISKNDSAVQFVINTGKEAIVNKKYKKFMEYKKYKLPFVCFLFKDENLKMVFLLIPKDEIKEYYRQLCRGIFLILKSKVNELLLKERYEETSKLIEISNILNSTLNLNLLLQRIISEGRKALKVEGCSVILKDNKTGDLVFHTVSGKKSKELKKIKIPPGKGIAGWIIENRKPAIVNDVTQDKRFYSGADRRSGFKTRNLLGVPLFARDKLLGLIEAVNKKGGENFTESDMKFLMGIANQAGIAIQNAIFYKENRNLFISIIKTLINAVEAKDIYTRGHSERVTKYTILLAKELNLNGKELENIFLSALLHDIGKIGINEAILLKPGKLTPEEFEEIKKHPIIGERIMAPITALKDVLPGIRNHHERWDGRGYPDGLKGEDIPLAGRIIALADTFDAMTSDRPYRKALPVKVALEEIKRCAGSQFDPYIAEKFIKLVKRKKDEILKMELDYERMV